MEHGILWRRGWSSSVFGNICSTRHRANHYLCLVPTRSTYLQHFPFSSSFDLLHLNSFFHHHLLVVAIVIIILSPLFPDHSLPLSPVFMLSRAHYCRVPRPAHHLILGSDLSCSRKPRIRNYYLDSSLVHELFFYQWSDNEWQQLVTNPSLLMNS